MGSTAKLIERVGASQGTIFGRYTDLEIYQFLLEGRHEVFAGLLKELTQGLIAEDVRVVAGDAPEGANPTHDLCRHLIDGAVAAAERVLGHPIANYEFVLDAPPNNCAPELRASAVWVHLDEAALERKLEAALAYTELRGETEEGLKYYGKKAFSVECLIPSTTRTAVQKFEHEAPAYERYGREGVERFGKSFGKYEEVITFQKHVKPVVRVIEEAARDFVPAT
jgi:AcrR family transcriptional regulator